MHYTFRWCIRFYPLDIIYTTCVPNGLVRNYSDISQWTCNLNQSSVRRLHSVFDIFFFSIRVFFRKKRRLTGQQEKSGGHLYSTLPLPPTHEYSDIYFATLHVRWLSHIFNRTACIYQAATRWDLPPYRITIWLIDDVMLIFVCLLVDFIQGSCYSYLTLETGELEHLMRLTLKELIHPEISYCKINFCVYWFFGNFAVYWQICENLSTSNLFYFSYPYK